MILDYEIKENGYEIYNEGKLWVSQYEPYIPRPKLSYEENAKLQIEELTKSAEKENSLEEKIDCLEEEVANLSYSLMMGGML